MPSSHPTVVQGQRISDPFLNVLDDYLVDSFPDEAALTAWTAQRNAAGRPVPNGKIVLVIDDFQYRHRNGNMWVRKFPRVVEETEVSQADLGSVPVKHLDWSVRPQAAWADHWAGEISAGVVRQHRLAVHRQPQRSAGLRDTGAASQPHGRPDRQV